MHPAVEGPAQGLEVLKKQPVDMVISDRVAPSSPGLRFYSHPVAASPMAWFATPALATAAAIEAALRAL